MLDQIRNTRANHPPRILIHGPHKIGKTTLAANAPGAIFIPTEDGQDNVDVPAFPLAHSWEDVLNAVAALYQGEHTYQTVVLDSADWAERLAQAAVCKRHKKDSIEEIGYGKGYVFAADLFGELLEGLNALRLQRGMGVIILAHSEIRKFDDPLADSYDRWQVKLNRHTSKVLQEWCDVIGFAQLDTATTQEEGGFNKKKTRAVDTGRRVLRLAPSAAFDAGNRYGLPATLPLDYAAFDAALKEARNG